MLRSLPEAPEHVPAREELLDRCFGETRYRKTSEKLRRGRLPAAGLAFSLLDGTRLVGTLRLWHIKAGSAGPALLLGPIAVEPEFQRAGWGAVLMRQGLAEAARLGHAAVLLVGDEPYYARFGFSQGLTEDLVLPGPVERERFLGLELLPGALNGARGRVVASGVRVTAAGAPANVASTSSPETEHPAIPTQATAR
jgi:predicted N-acetyltransferase YhbS